MAGFKFIWELNQYYLVNEFFVEEWKMIVLLQKKNKPDSKMP